MDLIKILLILFAFSFSCYSSKAKNEKEEVEKLKKCHHPCYFIDSRGEHFACVYPYTKKGFITLSDSVEIWTEIEGSGEDVILLIQGGPLFDHRYFHPQFSTLAKNYKIVYTDLRGRYMSEESSDEKYSILQDIEDLEDIRKRIGIKEWTVVGHSFGGFLAILYALKYPEAINLAITISTPLGITQQDFDSISKILNKEYFSEIKTIEENIKAQKKLNFFNFPKEADTEYWEKTLFSYNNYDKFEKLNVNYFKNSEIIWIKYLGPKFLELYDSLEINIPFIALNGQRDKLGFCEKTKVFVKTHFKNLNSHFYCFQNSSHFPWIDEKELFFSLLNGLIKENKKKKK